MIDQQQYTTLEREVYQAADRNDMIRLSGDLLARVDESLRQKVNAHQSCIEECRMLARACALHLDLLLASGESAEVYATALTALLMLDMAGQGSENTRISEVFELTAEATIAFAELASSMPHDEFTMQHVPVLYTLWGSRLYFFYQKCDKATVPLPHLLKASHSILEQLIESNAVVWPEIEIDDQKVSVDSSAVLADIIARSVALNIFK